ncbi:MAG TPA: nuclear transport factor 2 family protein [Pyrinomonadaceae bacterium]|jgi:ketosteroid isomerase-like protein|nr:nuclear transport factor 2 family protein [Pyrinomonadaceae bacterium]
MKKFICLFILLAFVTAAWSQRNRNTSSAHAEASALQSMVDTELAFAKMAAEQGIRPAFMQFIADDGVLFRPRAVRGKQWMAEHPVPPAEKHPLLSWYPTIAGASRAADLGYTTGPWEFRNDRDDAQAVAWGSFLTVWKRQADGSWKFAIDLGISNPRPNERPAPWELPKNYKASKHVNEAKSSGTADLLARDREFSKASAMRGARAAFDDYAFPDVRVYREGKFPSIGRDSAIRADSTLWTWEPAAGEASASDDLGYTYGAYRIASNEATPKILEAGNYYRIWKKQGNRWQVLFDLTNPIPPETKTN